MKSYKPGEKVRAVSSLREINDVSRYLIPAPACEMLGELVTIRDQPIPDWPLYRIEEDGGKYLYPVAFFKQVSKEKSKDKQHIWTEKELAEARLLICELLTVPDKHRSPDAYYRFVDLVTPYKTGQLKEGSPRVLLVRTAMRGLDVHVYSGVACPKDEPSLLIGMVVCLCKAKNVPIPQWILHPTERQEVVKCS